MNKILLPIICAAITAFVLRPSYAAELPLTGVVKQFLAQQTLLPSLQQSFRATTITISSSAQCPLS